MEDFINEVILANKQIIFLLKNGYDDSFHHSQEIGAGGDRSINIDLIAEKIFIQKLSRFGNIHSEEIGYIDNNSSYDIIIDPIDGSDNFASHIPYFGTSVALKYNNTCICAIIVNLANLDIIIKENKRFQIAKIDTLEFKNINNNPYSKTGLFERAYRSKRFYQIFKDNDIKYRSLGALALSLAYAHEVNFVLFEGSQRAYDIEAGLYMCEDLHVIKNNNFLFVSKNKELFDKIAKFIK